jgi:hypothetical protein
MHTVFSDGDVWPPIRVEEAWREGFDAISITEHIEAENLKNEVLKDHNRAYDLALSRAEALNLILIKGSEITRDMPPGHFNAIFLKNSDPLDTEVFIDAVKAAIDQKAFVFWNHPGWRGQQPDGVPRWYDIHTQLYEKGWMHGIEIVNEKEYYPLVHQWCLEKKLTMIGNSDIHDPINMEYDFHKGDHRAMTLVFAMQRTPEAIKDALFDRRTAVYHKNFLIGEEKYVKPIFDESIEIVNPDVTLMGRRRAYVQIHNRSDIPFELTADAAPEDISIPEHLTFPGGKTVLFVIRAKSDTSPGKKTLHLNYKVKNILIAPEETLPVEIKINVTFKALSDK